MTRGITMTLAVCLGLAAGFAQQPAPMGSSTGRPMRQAPAAATPQSSPQPPQLSDEDIMVRAEKTALATMNWDQSSTSGAKVEIQLIKQADVEGKTLMDYRIKISGGPHDHQYTLMTWPVTTSQPVATMDGLVIAADGTVGCPADSTKSCAQRFKGSELHLTYIPTKGEIYRHVLISEDRQARIFFSIVPDPFVVTDKACSLEVVRLSPQFELVIVRGKGYGPGEVFRFHTQSYQEMHDVPVTVDSRGEFQAHLTPVVKGRVAGTTVVTAAAKSCSPSISFNWGQQP